MGSSWELSWYSAQAEKAWPTLLLRVSYLRVASTGNSFMEASGIESSRPTCHNRLERFEVLHVPAAASGDTQFTLEQGDAIEAFARGFKAAAGLAVVLQLGQFG